MPSPAWINSNFVNDYPDVCLIKGLSPNNLFDNPHSKEWGKILPRLLSRGKEKYEKALAIKAF